LRWFSKIENVSCFAAVTIDLSGLEALHAGRHPELSIAIGHRAFEGIGHEVRVKE